MLHEIIKISHLCHTFHLQGIPEPIKKYSRTDIFCNILPSCDNFLPQISDHFTNSNQAFNTLQRCCTAKGIGSAEGTQPWGWGEWQQIRAKADLVSTASIQQRYLFNNKLNHMFKCALMDVSMASSILLNVSVWWTRTWAKCGAECGHYWPMKAAPPCHLFVIITSG